MLFRSKTISYVLTPAQLRMLTAAKTALAVVIALGIAMALNWERPYWTGITVMIVSLPYVGAALEKSFLRILGTICAGALAYLLTGAFQQDQVAMCVSLFVILTGLGYGAMGKTTPYFFLLSGITLCIILGQTIPDPTQLWHLTLYRTLEVCLGIVVALAVNSLLWPQHASVALRHKVAQVLDDSGELLALACRQYLDGEKLPDDLLDRERAIAAQFPALVTLHSASLRESSHLLHHAQAVEETIRETRQCFVAAITCLRAAASDFPRTFQQLTEPELRAKVEALQADFRQLAQDLRADQPPRKLTASAEARDRLEARLNELRATGISFDYPIEDVSNYYAFLGDLDSLREAMVRLAQGARTLYRDADAHLLPARIPVGPQNAHERVLRLQHGVKVGIACIVALYLYLGLKWPGGATSFLTCAIVAQVSLSASNQKSLLRLGGCLLGGVCGAFTLAVVEPAVSDYATYSIPLFGLFYLFAWINNGPQKYAYAGFQAHLAFLLMTSISPTQSVDLKAGFDRFMGILLGVFIAALVQRLIWPVLPEKEFCRALSLFFERAGKFLHTQDARLEAQCGSAPEREQERELALIESLPATTLSWLDQIGFSDKNASEKAALTQSFLLVQSLNFALRGMAQANARQMKAELLTRLRPELTALDHALADSLDRCAHAFEVRENFTSGDAVTPALLRFEERLRNLTRVERATRELSGIEVGGFLALVRRYRELSNLAIACEKHTARLNFEALNRSAFF